MTLRIVAELSDSAWRREMRARRNGLSRVDVRPDDGGQNLPVALVMRR